MTESNQSRPALRDAIADAQQHQLDPIGETVTAPPEQARARKQASQVYSVRMPVDRLEQLRSIAAEEGTPPTQLLRDWVIERLDQEQVKRGPGGAHAPLETAPAGTPEESGPMALAIWLQAQAMVQATQGASEGYEPPPHEAHGELTTYFEAPAYTHLVQGLWPAVDASSPATEGPTEFTIAAEHLNPDDLEISYRDAGIRVYTNLPPGRLLVGEGAAKGPADPSVRQEVLRLDVEHGRLRIRLNQDPHTDPERQPAASFGPAERRPAH